MKVTLTVDALAPVLSGIGRYCWELTQRIPSLTAPDPVYFYRDASLWDNPASFLVDRQLTKRAPRFLRKWRGGLNRNRVIKTLRESLVHSPNYFLPEAVEGGVVTVHDLSVFKFPETHPIARLHHFERDFARSLERASLIITDTETVRREVCDYTGFPDSRVVAVPLGVDPRYRPMSENFSLARLSKWNLSHGRYGLCVAALEPRKGIDRLIAAWSRLPIPLRQTIPLVLAGPRGWLNDALEADIEKGQAQGWLRHLGFVDEADLPALYAGAAVFAYPSVYEGFGLPLVEAMACAVPVIASDCSCMPEVCGDAALLVESGDDDALVAAITRCLTDEAWRSTSTKRGLARSSAFTWEACALHTYHAYELAMALR